MSDTTVGSRPLHEAEGLSAAVEIPTVPNEAVVQTHRRPRTRRNHQRLDELGSLHPITAPSASPVIRSPNVSKTVRKILFCLFRLDLYTLETFQVAWFATTPPLIKQVEWLDFKQLVGEEIYSFIDDDFIDDDIYDNQNVARVRLDLDQRSDGLLIERLLDTRTSRYYTKILKLCILLYRIAQSKQRYAEKVPNLIVPESESWRCHSPEAYLVHLITKVTSSRHRLKTVIRDIRTLCDCVKDASEGGELDESSLESQKLNMIALQEYFHEACKELGELPYSLTTSLGSSRWWHSETEIIQSSYTSQAPAAAVQAYKETSNINATLTFLVPTISLISCIPAALAWTNSSPQVGTHHDTDFYQLISSSTVQLLGLLTLIWSTITHKRLASHAWFWTWVLASVSALLTVLAVPLYLVLPTGWSALLSFSGSIAQILVLLQLVYTI